MTTSNELPSPFEPDEDNDGWPDPVDSPDATKGTPQSDELYKAKLAHISALRDDQIADAASARVAATAARSAEGAAVIAVEKSFLDSVLEVGRGRVDRARVGAETVQKAAAAIATLYTGVLGLVFSVTSNPLPPRGLIAPALLGLAITFSTVYLAYQSEDEGQPEIPDHASSSNERVASLARAFVRWARSQAREKLYWLRVSVIMLGVAVFFLPAPFISFLAARTDSEAAAEAAAAGGSSVESKQDGASASGAEDQRTDAQAALDALTPYPEPPATDSLAARIRYRAEVAEIRAIRTEELKPDSARKGYDLVWALAALVCVVAAMIMPRIAVWTRVETRSAVQRFPR